MQNKLIKKGFIFALIVIYIITIFFPSAITKTNFKSDDICDIPTWYKGDEWSYTANPVVYSSKNGSFNGKILNLKHQLLDVKTISHNGENIEVYQLEITGDISGNFVWEIISGYLEGTVQGISYIRVSDLAEVKTEIISTGTVTILFIKKDYEMNSSNSFFPPLEIYDFPIRINEKWDVSSNIILDSYFVLEDLINEDFSGSTVLDETIQCTTKEIVSVQAGDFDCFKINHSTNTIWFSPEVGNIVRSEIDESNENSSFNMVLSLKSFTRNIQPITITESITPKGAIIDQNVVISGRAIDSQTNDPISNTEILIEIPRVGESWITTTNNDGYYNLTIEAPLILDDTPSDYEFGSDGIIVRCFFEDLYGYKIKSLSILADFPPEAPQINGQINGKINTLYEYSFYSVDPDGDDVYLWIEWGDGTVEQDDWIGPYSSGEKITISHSWAEKGDYEIKAKTKEINGAESKWGTLKVTMPIIKSFGFNFNLFSWFFNHFPNVFPIIQRILG